MSDFIYGWETATHTAAHSYLLPALNRWIASTGLDSLADVGAGNGAVAQYLASRGLSIVCIEPSNDGIRHISDSAPNIDVHQLSVYDTCPPELQSKFEAAYSLEVIEHLNYPAKLFTFAGELLKPNGRFLVTTPYHGYLKNLALSLMNKWDVHADPFWDTGHIRFFSVKTISRMARENGFEVVQVRRIGRIPSLAKSMAVEFRKLPNRD